MNNCPRCEGFVPPQTTTCPNCDTSLSQAMLRTAAKMVVGTMAAITLMACYGGGADDWGPTDCVDNDNDGACEGSDCNDGDATVTTDCCQDADGDGVCATEDCNDFDSSKTSDCCADNDGDGFCAEQDCDDGDATAWEWCDDICELTSPISEPSTMGSTLEGTDLTQTCGGGASEVVYTLVVEGEPGVLQYVTAEVQSDSAHYLAARAACLNAGDIACGYLTPQIELLATPGETLWLIVEAATPATQGEFELIVDVRPLVCGDGVVVGPEACDDGNVEDGDGCDANCQLEGAQP